MWMQYQCLSPQNTKDTLVYSYLYTVAMYIYTHVYLQIWQIFKFGATVYRDYDTNGVLQGNGQPIRACLDFPAKWCSRVKLSPAEPKD